MAGHGAGSRFRDYIWDIHERDSEMIGAEQRSVVGLADG
jgi:hypothetical protein